MSDQGGRGVLAQIPNHSAQVRESCLWGGPGAEQGVRWRRAILSFWIEKARAIYGESVLENVFTKPVDVWAEEQIRIMIEAAGVTRGIATGG